MQAGKLTDLHAPLELDLSLFPLGLAVNRRALGSIGDVPILHHVGWLGENVVDVCSSAYRIASTHEFSELFSQDVRYVMWSRDPNTLSRDATSAHVFSSFFHLPHHLTFSPHTSRMPSLFATRSVEQPRQGSTFSRVTSFKRDWGDDDENAGSKVGLKGSSRELSDWSPSPEA